MSVLDGGGKPHPIETLVTTFIFIVLPLSGIAGIVSSCTKQRCYQKKVVKTVGGCNNDGMCSVMYKDGTVDRYVFQPVKGEKRNVQVECQK